VRKIADLGREIYKVPHLGACLTDTAQQSVDLAMFAFAQSSGSHHTATPSGDPELA